MVKRNAAEIEHAYYAASAYALIRVTLRIVMERRGWTLERLAKEVRVPAGQLQAFLDGGDATMRLWKGAVRVAKAVSPADREAHIEDVALNLVSDTFPRRERVRVRRVLRDALVAALESLGRNAPLTD